MKPQVSVGSKSIKKLDELHQDNMNNRRNSSLSSNHPGAKQLQAIARQIQWQSFLMTMTTNNFLSKSQKLKYFKWCKSVLFYCIFCVNSLLFNELQCLKFKFSSCKPLWLYSIFFPLLNINCWVYMLSFACSMDVNNSQNMWRAPGG